MIRNADTFMVTISALQVLGSNQAAPAIVLTPNTLTTTVSKDGGTEIKSEVVKAEAPKPGEAKPASDANAKFASQILHEYLSYRAALAGHEMRAARKQPKKMLMKPKSAS